MRISAAVRVRGERSSALRQATTAATTARHTGPRLPGIRADDPSLSGVEKKRPNPLIDRPLDRPDDAIHQGDIHETRVVALACGVAGQYRRGATLRHRNERRKVNLSRQLVRVRIVGAEGVLE